MFDRKGQNGWGRSSKGSRGRARTGTWLQLEPLEGRALLTASLAPIPSVTVEATNGYQVPLNGSYGGNTDNETYSVTTDNPTGGVSATISSGEFWTITVNHVSSGAGDPAFSGSMTFQMFQDLTPNTVSKIESLITGTVPYTDLTTQAQSVIYPGGEGTTGVDYYTAAGDVIHRVANLTPSTTPGDVIVQGGSINGDGTGSVFETPFANETSPQLIFNGTGQLAMANAGGTDTNDSQYFITTGVNYGLDASSGDGSNYTIFGQLVSGQAILTDLSNVAVGGSSGTTPSGATTITASSLSTTSPDGVVHINATNASSAVQTNVTVTATDTADGTQTSQTFPVLTIASGTATSSTTTPPTLNTVATPVNTAVNTPTTFQLAATNPTGGTLSYIVQGGLTSNAFTSVNSSQATATVSSTGLVTVTPTNGYTGPVDLIVGVTDGTDRTGTGTASAPANYSLQNVVVDVGSFSAAPTINPVATPITGSISQNVQIQLSATNPSGGQLTYTVQGGESDGAFTQPTNATASVDANGLVTVIPTAGYTGPIDLLVGVRDQTNRAGTGASLDSPTNYSTENIVVNIGQPASTGAVRFIPDASSSASGNLVISPLPRPSKKAHNTIEVTQQDGNIEAIVNGVIDLNQPAINNVDSIIVYGSKANDRITIDPSLTMPVYLSGGDGGHDVLIAGGGQTREQGWHSANTVEKQGEAQNFDFGKAGTVTVVQGSGHSNVIFQGSIYKPKGHSRIRRYPPIPNGTYYKFVKGKLTPTADTFSTTKTIKNTTTPAS
jgi:cyclophilin family peptidyl-prolyl cis-trans isomerase